MVQGNWDFVGGDKKPNGRERIFAGDWMPYG